MRVLEIQLQHGDVPKYWDSEDYFQKLAEGDAVRLSADRAAAEAGSAVAQTTVSFPRDELPVEDGAGDGDAVDEGFAEASAAGAPADEQLRSTAATIGSSPSRGPPPSLSRFKPLPPILPKVATTVVMNPDTVSLA